jgi:peroxin-19
MKVVQVYETEPNNITKLTELMQEVQEYGQPPSEIIQEIAPDIELDANGIPIMGEVDSDGIPNMGQEECQIM